MDRNLEGLLLPREAAEYLKVTVNTLSTWRTHYKRMRNLPYYRIAGMAYYKLAGIMEWMENKKKTPHSEKTA